MQATSKGVAEAWIAAGTWIAVERTLFYAVVLVKSIHRAGNAVLLWWVLDGPHYEVKNITCHSSLGAHRIELRELDALYALNVLQLVQIPPWNRIPEQSFYFTARFFSTVAVLWPSCCRNRVILACLDNLIISLIVLFHSLIGLCQGWGLFLCRRLFAFLLSLLRVSYALACRSWCSSTIRLKARFSTSDFLLFRSLLKIILAIYVHCKGRWLLKNVNKFLDVGPRRLVIVSIRLHEKSRICLQIKLWKFCIVIETLAIVLEVEVCEEASVDVLTQELPELK